MRCSRAEGHLAVARANAACGTASIVPEVGSFSYEEVAAAAPAAARIGQLHPFESFDPVARRIKAAGYDALCVTVDCATMGWRVRNKMARFRFDPGVWFGNVTDDGEPNVASTFGGGVIPDWTWDQLAEATARHGLPWIAKGILTAESARSRRSTRARPRSWSPTTAAARSTRPRPASTRSRRSPQAVGGQVPLLLDSGVRTGADVFLALALGASAVVIGRLAAYGLAAAGEYGVRRTIELLTAGAPHADDPGRRPRHRLPHRRRVARRSARVEHGQDNRDQHGRQPGRTGRVHQDRGITRS